MSIIKCIWFTCFTPTDLNQIKSNQIVFKASNIHLKEMKISEKLFI